MSHNTETYIAHISIHTGKEPSKWGSMMASNNSDRGRRAEATDTRWPRQTSLNYILDGIGWHLGIERTAINYD